VVFDISQLLQVFWRVVCFFSSHML
jgi:hypothetical protein